MAQPQLLVCYESDFGVQLKVAHWWPTLQSFHVLAFVCVPLHSSRTVAPLELERSTTTAK